MSMVFVFLYIILGYWATGKTIYANSSLPKYLANFPNFTGFSAHSLVK